MGLLTTVTGTESPEHSNVKQSLEFTSCNREYASLTSIVF